MPRALLTTVEKSAGNQWSGKQMNPVKALSSPGTVGYPKLHSPSDTSEAQHIGSGEVERKNLH